MAVAKAELRVRNGRTIGVLWPVNEEGLPDENGKLQLEWEFGPAGADGQPLLGDKVTFHLMMTRLAQLPGWSLVPLKKETETGE